LRFFRGSNQTRTGVNGFADRYLTTRTWNPFATAKLVQIFESAKFSSQFSGKISGKNLVRLIIQCGAVLLSGRSCSVIRAALFCYPGGAVPLSGRRCSVIRAALFCYPAKPGFYFKESRIDSSSTPLTSTARGLPPWLGPTIPACSSWSMIRPARL
jgi:hypothetical protein